MPAPTPTPACSSTTRNWPFGYSAKLRPHRRALAASASLAALLCAAALMPGSAEAACPTAPPAGSPPMTVTIDSNDCASINTSAFPANSNLLVTGNMPSPTGGSSFYFATTDWGDITIRGSVTNNVNGNIIQFDGATPRTLGNINLEQSSTVTLGSSSTNPVMALTNLSAMGSLTTAGTINALGASAAIRLGTISAKPVTVNGNITNSGTATIGSAIATTGYYLRAENGTINGNIVNSGTITAGGGSTRPYAIGVSMVVNGSILNSGTMNGAVTAGTETVSAIRVAPKLISTQPVYATSVSGSITNSGRILGYGDGIRVEANIDGSLVNSNQISVARYGLHLTSSGAVSTVSNSGTITAGNAGIFASGTWTVRDSIVNSGTISVSGAAGDGISLTGTTVNGSLTNSNQITAGRDGVSLSGTTLKGGILNTGTVSAGRFGFALANAGAIASFDNLGTISGGSFDISATGTTRIGTLTNAQGAGNPAGGVTYSGTLPTNYHTVINGQSYGQLFADATTLTGTTTFAISPLSGSVLAQTYSAVLTGVSAANLTNPDQKVHAFGNRVGLVLERQAGSDTTWDLVLDGLWTPFIGWDYPDVDPTVAALRSNQQAINRIFAERSAALAAAAQYDCDSFDVNGFCVQIAGRASTVDGEAETAAVFNAAARLTSTLRMGLYLDQQASQTDSMVASGPGSVAQDYDMPLFGAYLGYAAQEDGTGLQARASTGYMAGDLDIRRGFLTQSEPASGSAALEAFYARATLGYGFLIGRNTRLTPYVGLDYTSLDRDGYSEGYDASETLFPITYDSYHDRLLSGLAGAEVAGLFREDAGYRAALGVAFDLSRDANGYGGHSEIPGLETIDLSHDQGSRADIRPTGLAELFFDPAPNQRISATAFAAQDAWSEDIQATGMIAYRFSF